MTASPSSRPNDASLEALTYQSVRDRPFEVAVLPLGATEPHNLHLPYGTDTIQVDRIAADACEAANQRGARVVLLPTIPYGTETNLNAFPLAMNLDPTTLGQVLSDLADSVEEAGIDKLVLINGHGGNDLKWWLREQYSQTDVQLFVCHWFKMVADLYGEIFDDPGDHAGELETSLMLEIRPDLVELEQADAGSMATPRLEAIRRGWVEITRPWDRLTTNSGAGDPRTATAAKGRRILEHLQQRLSDFLVELAEAEIDDAFPFEPGSPGPR